MQNFDMIDDYMENRLDKAAKAAFEERLSMDKAFKDALTHRSNLNA